MNTAVLLSLVLTGASVLVYALILVLYRVSIRKAEHAPASASDLRFSILKPLAGHDDDLDENLDSFAALRGADFEILLGVASMDDPAFDSAWRFVRRHPGVNARVVVTDPGAAENPKVAQLMGLEPRATGDILVISDSNVRVEPDYLLHLAEALETPGTHLVSTLVRGTGERTAGALLENVILATHVAPGVAAGYALTDRAITIGKSMAMWRGALRTVGGFRAVKDCLAEDHVLGQLFAKAGFGVRVIPYFVENRNVNCSLSRSFERHARWAKLRRTLSPAGFALEPLMWPAVVALAGAALAPSVATTVALTLALLAQGVGAQVLLGPSFRGGALRATLLEWTRTFVLLACWASAWLSRTVEWRGNRLTIGAGTRIAPRRARAQPSDVQAAA